jgi:hypothetical protein
MFPTATSTVYYNEDGEVLGWDTNSDDPHDDPYGDDDYGPEPEPEEDDDDEAIVEFKDLDLTNIPKED